LLDKAVYVLVLQYYEKNFKSIYQEKHIMR
jgi:hypothetical protein